MLLAVGLLAVLVVSAVRRRFTAPALAALLCLVALLALLATLGLVLAVDGEGLDAVAGVPYGLVVQLACMIAAAVVIARFVFGHPPARTAPRRHRRRRARDRDAGLPRRLGRLTAGAGRAPRP